MRILLIAQRYRPRGSRKQRWRPFAYVKLSDAQGVAETVGIAKKLSEQHTGITLSTATRYPSGALGYFKRIAGPQKLRNA